MIHNLFSPLCVSWSFSKSFYLRAEFRNEITECNLGSDNVGALKPPWNCLGCGLRYVDGVISVNIMWYLILKRYVLEIQVSKLWSLLWLTKKMTINYELLFNLLFLDYIVVFATICNMDSYSLIHISQYDCFSLLGVWSKISCGML